jgi:hypothetical protein
MGSFSFTSHYSLGGFMGFDFAKETERLKNEIQIYTNLLKLGVGELRQTIEERYLEKKKELENLEKVFYHEW